MQVSTRLGWIGGWLKIFLTGTLGSLSLSQKVKIMGRGRIFYYRRMGLEQGLNLMRLTMHSMKLCCLRYIFVKNEGVASGRQF